MARAQLAPLTSALCVAALLAASLFSACGKQSVPQTPVPPRVGLDSLSHIVFGTLGLTADTSCHDSACVLPEQVLAQRRGNCTGITAVALHVADSLGFPMEAVLLPSHVYLRWRKTELTWEPNAEGSLRPVGYYDSAYGLDGTPGRRTLILPQGGLAAVVQRELVAAALAQGSASTLGRERLSEMELSLRRALAVLPDWVAARGDLAVVLAAQGRRQEARDILEELLADGVDDPVLRENLERLR